MLQRISYTHTQMISTTFAGISLDDIFCEITVVNDSRMGENAVILTKNCLNTKKFPQPAVVGGDICILEKVSKIHRLGKKSC